MTIVYLLNKYAGKEESIIISILISLVFFNVIMMITQSYFANTYIEGTKLLKKEKYKEAIKLFQKSAEYYAENKWIDKYRFLLFISISELTFKERSLSNLAYCYSQLLDGEKAKEYYELTLKEFPKNQQANIGLNFLNAGFNSNLESENNNH